MPIERPNQFKILLSDLEKAWLERLAESRGLTSAAVLRLYIRDAYAALGDMNPQPLGSSLK